MSAQIPIGWYVRVTTGEIVDQVHDTMLYIAGYATPAEAEVAVRKAHVGPAKRFEVLDGEITPGVGPQLAPGEVRLLKGAV